MHPIISEVGLHPPQVSAYAYMHDTCNSLALMASLFRLVAQARQTKAFAASVGPKIRQRRLGSSPRKKQLVPPYTSFLLIRAKAIYDFLQATKR